MTGYITESTKSYNKIEVGKTYNEEDGFTVYHTISDAVNEHNTRDYNIYEVEIIDGGMLKIIRQIMLF